MAFGTRTNETDDGGCLPETRRIRSKNFYSVLAVSNGKDGRVVVAIDDRHAVVKLSSLATPDERDLLSWNWERKCASLYSYAEGVVDGRFRDPECTSPYRKRQSWSRQATSASWKRESVSQTRPTVGRGSCRNLTLPHFQLRYTTQKSRQQDPASFELIAHCLPRPSTKAGLLPRLR